MHARNRKIPRQRPQSQHQIPWESIRQAILVKEGQTAFENIEQIRKTAIRLHRDQDQDAAVSLKEILKQLDPEQAVPVVRAFGHFKHLINIAEDLYSHERARLSEDDVGPGMIAHTLEQFENCLLYTSPSPRDRTRPRMPSSA